MTSCTMEIKESADMIGLHIPRWQEMHQELLASKNRWSLSTNQWLQETILKVNTQQNTKIMESSNIKQSTRQSWGLS